jgi:hypothetical protein
LKDVNQERLEAARASDAAPLNEELMRRATALWEDAKVYIEWNDKRKLAETTAIKASEDAGKSEDAQKEAGLAARNAFISENPKPPVAKWDIDVPATKAYMDPLYKDVENDPNPDVWDARAEGGKRREPKRSTRKRRNREYMNLTHKRRESRRSESRRSEPRRIKASISKSRRITRRNLIKERRRFTR